MYPHANSLSRVLVFWGAYPFSRKEGGKMYWHTYISMEERFVYKFQHVPIIMCFEDFSPLSQDDFVHFASVSPDIIWAVPAICVGNEKTPEPFQRFKDASNCRSGLIRPIRSKNHPGRFGVAICWNYDQELPFLTREYEPIYRWQQ